jgi:hypothetical protein
MTQTIVNKRVDTKIFPWDSGIKLEQIPESNFSLPVISTETEQDEYIQKLVPVSRDYLLIPNKQANDIALDVITRTGLNFEEGRSIWTGKTFSRRWIIPSIQAEVAPGDLIALAIDLHNSYDKTTTFGLAFNLQRLVCSNGMIVDQHFGFFRFRHINGNGEFQKELDEACDQIQGMTQNIHSILPRFQRFQQSLGSGRMLQICSDLVTGHGFPGSRIGDVLNVTRSEMKGDPTYWDLYNGFTKVCTDQNSLVADGDNREVTNFFLEQVPSIN